MLRYVTICYNMLRYITICYDILRYVTVCMLVAFHLLLSRRHCISIQGASVTNLNHSVIQRVNHKLSCISDSSDNTRVLWQRGSCSDLKDAMKKFLMVMNSGQETLLLLRPRASDANNGTADLKRGGESLKRWRFALAEAS